MGTTLAAPAPALLRRRVGPTGRTAGARPRRLARWLAALAVVLGLLARFGFEFTDFSYFFDGAQANDFGEAINNIKDNSRCLAMDRRPVAIGDRHNWTFREHTDRSCKIGEPFAIA